MDDIKHPVLVVGSIGIDSITTPFGEATDFLGGSVIYSSLAARFFAKPIILATGGTDLPKGSIEMLDKMGVDHSNLLLDGKTFRWHGQYDYSGNVKTLKTGLEGVTSQFPPLPKDMPKFVLLSNHNPEIHLQILDELPKDTFTLADTIEFWIQTKPELVKQVLKRVKAVTVTEGEARQIAETSNTIVAGRYLLNLGPEFVCVKKGEHGVLLFSKYGLFSLGAYPLENVVDPTGAGDSFAGALIGYLSKQEKIEYKQIKEAVVWAGAVASFTPEAFGPESLFNVTQNQIKERYNALIQLHQV